LHDSWVFHFENVQYSGVGVTTMSTKCHIEPVGNQLIVVDPWGEIVGRYPTEDAARQDIERCLKEDAMWESAKLLVDMAIKTHMQLHDVDRETASYWINSALGG
jgi:hypothetical protein